MSKKTGVVYASTVLWISAAVLFTSAAQAMEIRQFDKMVKDDQAEYVAGLVQGAEKVLTDAGKPDLAAQVKHLFTTKDPDLGQIIGMVEFEGRLGIMREFDAQSDVEGVMSATLAEDHIELPAGFDAVVRNFKPKHPPKENIGGDLREAVKANDTEKVKALLAHGADVNAKDDSGWTLLHRAAVQNAKAVAELLLGKGADVNAKDEDGWTPLHVAANNNAKDVAALLLANGADVNAKDEDGWTPLHRAADKNSKEVAALLLAKGADVNAKTKKSGETPLDWAVQKHRYAVAGLLRAHGEKPAAAATPPPAAPSSPPANDDDPIGSGGFITPPDSK